MLPGSILLPCLVLLQMGFTRPASHPAAGELLPHHFALTRLVPLGRSSIYGVAGRYVSVALSLSHPHWPLASILLCGVRTFLGRCRPRSPVLLAPTMLD